jgi:hypothetical protein
MRAALPLILVAGCLVAPPIVPNVARAQDGAHSDSRVLPPPPSGAPEYAAAGIATPFERIGSQAGSMRTIFRGPGPDGTTVEIREIIVAPHGSVRLDPLPGPALIDLRAGEGRALGGSPVVDLTGGASTALAAGLPLELSNSGEVPLVIRIRLVEGR